MNMRLVGLLGLLGGAAAVAPAQAQVAPSAQTGVESPAASREATTLDLTLSKEF